MLFLATILRPWLKGKVDYITEQDTLLIIRQLE